MDALQVTHYFTFFQSLGGVQSLLRRHLEKDAAWGLNSNIAAFFDPPASDTAGVRGVGLSWRSTVRSARAAFRQRLADFKRPIAIYNNFWGVPFFADLDGAKRRLAVLHSYAPVLRNCLEAEDGLVDGVLCVSRPLQETVCRHLSSLEKSRVALLPLPIGSCPFPVQHEPLRNRPLRVGIAGRLQKEQKRVDRLPGLVARLESKALPFRLEVLGGGPSEKWLKRQFGGNRNVALLGHQTGEAYWRALAGWDAIIFTSDYEGLPLALLEAMSVGVIPIYPRIGSGGDNYVSDLNPEFLYPPGDLSLAAAALGQLAAAAEERCQAWRVRSQQLVQSHQGDAYHAVFTAFVQEIVAAPRVSAGVFPTRRFHLSDHVPFGLLVRTWLPGFYQRNDR